MSEYTVNLFAFWRDNYVDSETLLCSLCGNRGMIDTRSTAISHAGVKSGKEQFCICPNGLTMREQSEPKTLQHIDQHIDQAQTK